MLYVYVRTRTQLPSHFPTSFHLWNLMIRDSSRRFRVLGYSLLPRHWSFDLLPVPLYLSSCYSCTELIRALSRYRRNNETSRRFIVSLPHQNHRIKDSRVRTRWSSRACTRKDTRTESNIEGWKYNKNSRRERDARSNFFYALDCIWKGHVWTTSFLQIHRAPFSFRRIEQYKFYAPMASRIRSRLREQLVEETYSFLFF